MLPACYWAIHPTMYVICFCFKQQCESTQRHSECEFVLTGVDQEFACHTQHASRWTEDSVVHYLHISLCIPNSGISWKTIDRIQVIQPYPLIWFSDRAYHCSFWHFQLHLTSSQQHLLAGGAATCMQQTLRECCVCLCSVQAFKIESLKVPGGNTVVAWK